MTIFKYQKDNKNYTIEILKHSYPFLDGNTRLGVWARPYMHVGPTFFYHSTDNKVCNNFVKENFEIVTELNAINVFLQKSGEIVHL